MIHFCTVFKITISENENYFKEVQSLLQAFILEDLFDLVHIFIS